MRTSIIALFGAVVAVSATAADCDKVYDDCIAAYTSQGQSPFFPECNSRKAACLAGEPVPTTPVPTFPAAVTPSASAPAAESEKCDKVYNDCINAYTSQGQSPFFPECNSRKAACLGGAPIPTTPVPTFPAAGSPSASATSSEKCDKVYNDCINAYTSQGQSPFFPECNSRKAACLGGAPNPTTPVPTFPAAGTPSPSASSKCRKVFDKCVEEYTSQNQTPFFPECASRQAACEAGSAVPTTPVPTFPAAPVYVTEVVTALTTFCPEPTTLTYNSKTYTVTSATTLTITDCPCTISHPAPSPPPATNMVPSAPHSVPKPTPTAGTPPPAFSGAAVANEAGAALGFVALVAAAFI